MSESNEWAQIGAVRVTPSGRKYRCVAFEEIQGQIVTGRKGDVIVTWEPIFDGTVDVTAPGVSDMELPGMWSRSDFEGGESE